MYRSIVCLILNKFSINVPTHEILVHLLIAYLQSSNILVQLSSELQVVMDVVILHLHQYFM